MSGWFSIAVFGYLRETPFWKKYLLWFKIFMAVKIWQCSWWQECGAEAFPSQKTKKQKRVHTNQGWVYTVTRVYQSASLQLVA